MGYPLRYQEPNIVYHLTHRGNDRGRLFNDDADYEVVTRLLCTKNNGNINIYHYTLMPNHLHLQLEPLVTKAVSGFVQKVCAAYTRYFHKKYGSSGHIWQPRFFLGPIETEDYFIRCARYIELNAVRAGIVQHPSEYKWSSYKNSTLREPRPWLTTHPLLAAMQVGRTGNTAYEAFVENDVEQARLHKSETFSATQIYGSEPFRKRFPV